MKLSKYLADKFEEDFEEIFQKEKMDKDFLNQDQFNSCIERAEAGIFLATQRIKADLAYMIAVHREKEHGDNTFDEQAVLLEAGADADITAESWWTH